MDVPLIDFKNVSIDKRDHEIAKNDFQNVAGEIWRGFTQTGFLYIKNHGISEAEIQQTFAVSGAFFDLPDDTKRKYMVMKHTEEKHGYVPINGEMLGSFTKAEFRECFNIITTSNRLPESELPGFARIIDTFFQRCSLLALRVLRAIAVAMNLEDDEYFTKIQLPMDTDDNFTTLRLLNYPPISLNSGVEAQGVVRCGEHSDYGTVTLLFQDETGGLEVRTREGAFVHVAPVPGTVLVNVGNILDHMTHGSLTAAKHRVLLKDETSHKTRRAIAFFAHPVHNAKLECLTEPKDPNPPTAYEFVKKFFDSTYTV